MILVVPTLNLRSGCFSGVVRRCLTRACICITGISRSRTCLTRNCTPGFTENRTSVDCARSTDHSPTGAAMYANQVAKVFLVCLAGGALLTSCSLSTGERSHAAGAGADMVLDLEKRMESFLASFDSISAEDFVEFFPRNDEVAYRHTRHTSHGDEISIKRFHARSIPASLEYSGPLWPSFQFQFEGQPIGLLAHQVMVRTGRWLRFSEFRFVPPGSEASSPTYVEWRREGPRWVVSEFGDESFVDVDLPAWIQNP